MGASNSRFEEDKGLQLCRSRKKFIKQALNGRCFVAAAHIAYIEELKIIGAALRRFAEIDARVESFAFPSRNVTTEPLAFTEKSVSQLSVSSPSRSQYEDTTVNVSSSPSSQVLKYNSHHMKFRSTFSKKVEEKPPVHVAVSVISTTPLSTTPRSTEVPEASSFETPSIPSETPPWDYFGFFHPIDDHFPSRERNGFNHGSEHSDEIEHLRAEEGISDLEDVEEKLSSHGIDGSHDSDDGFDKPSLTTLVRSFKNVNVATGNDANNELPVAPQENRVSQTKLLSFENVTEGKESVVNEDSSIMSSETKSPGFENMIKGKEFVFNEDPSKKPERVASETKFINGKKNNSPDLSPLRTTSSRFMYLNNAKINPITESEVEDKVAPKDFFSSMQEIEHLFVKASESGKEVPRMLEANKFHFRPIFPGKERGSVASSLLKSCFSCGDDPSEIQQEPQNSVKYLTWHRTSSSRSASSRNLLGGKSIEDINDVSKNLFEDFCMVSGSHASTLDRLYAWEKKLYDEVKKESQGLNTDKTRARVKDLHSRIRVSIHRIDSISKKIEEIRDKELQPQLEELIEGLRRMWEMMMDCHRLQFHIISISIAPGSTKINIQSDSLRQISIHLENGLNTLSSNFTKWIGGQKIYVEAINKWLFKCISLPQNTTKRNKRMRPLPINECGPPIYKICDEWLEMIDRLPCKGVVDSIKDLAAEVAHFLPHQEKNQGKATNRSRNVSLLDGMDGDDRGITDEVLEDLIPAFDGFRTSLAGFLGKLNYFSECSVSMFTDLQKSIQDAKDKYERPKSQQTKVV